MNFTGRTASFADFVIAPECANFIYDNFIAGKNVASIKFALENENNVYIYSSDGVALFFADNDGAYVYNMTIQYNVYYYRVMYTLKKDRVVCEYNLYAPDEQSAYDNVMKMVETGKYSSLWCHKLGINYNAPCYIKNYFKDGCDSEIMPCSIAEAAYQKCMIQFERGLREVEPEIVFI